MQFVTRSEGGGVTLIKTRNTVKPHPSICLIPLWLSHLNRPAPLPTRESEKDESAPPQNRGVM